MKIRAPIIEITDISESKARKIILGLEGIGGFQLIILQSLSLEVEDDRFIININNGQLEFKFPLDKVLNLIEQAKKGGS